MIYLIKLSEQLKNGTKVTEPRLKELVQLMRTQRHPWMVEGIKQYELAYDITIKLIQHLS